MFDNLSKDPSKFTVYPKDALPTTKMHYTSKFTKGCIYFLKCPFVQPTSSNSLPSNQQLTNCDSNRLIAIDHFWPIVFDVAKVIDDTAELKIRKHGHRDTQGNIRRLA